ncbi:GuaB3 family IMP dehydrogenase-related protein [Corynebacterium aquatimens]|uniref:IMP dehydrogenase n=1 Tax=Corynebacterium aquatimens TaxID=1190508 RepID=A0A931E4R3_9CORY|nr:GuaB3 family IMP dehydrogenase-related protein [Corynebacterium aquatimens]MBG6123071.1 IMP dehydrogenase [Corynebacterium aquatimens]WJY66595.1 putative oxidoreductase [Corynebacterium aquatimens]
MRDYVEIGIGREARRTYDLEDIAIVPSRRTRSSQDVDVSWHIDAYSFDIPICSHPTDALAGPEFAIEMGKQGGLGVINAEGLLGRHEDLDGAVEKIIEARNGDGNATKVLQELHAAPLNTDLLADRIAQVRDSGVTVALRVSPQRARELADVVVKAGAELLFIQGTLISAEHVQKGGEPLNLKEFIGSLDVPVIAGGVNGYTTALHLMRAGAAGVIVGSGEVDAVNPLGIGNGFATQIADAAAARRDYLDETEGRYVHVLADCPMYTGGDIACAIACGADAVVLGYTLASAAEAAGKGYYWQSAAAHPRFPRGFVSATDEWVGQENQRSLESILKGPSTSAFGDMNLVGGLRRAMAKCGYTDIKSFQKVDIAVAN